MVTSDAFGLAVEAGLNYVEAGAPGYRRVRRGRGFSYVSPQGDAVEGRQRDWIRSLAVPPAWEDVWISTDRRGHILATGSDAAGRKQYIYHSDWEEIRDAVKFDSLGVFGQRLSGLRRRIDSDLRRHGLPRAKVVALAIAVLDRTLVRVGNKRSTGNDSYGLTTLTSDHIEVEGGHVHFEFTGKGGAERQLVFRDRRLSGLVARCQELSGQTLFSYVIGSSGTGSVTSTDINGYLADTMGKGFTAKDFRTWGASTSVVDELARISKPADQRDLLAAIDVAAERLGNTREVCRSSYVHPGVTSAAESGLLLELWKRSRPGKWIDRPESALRLVLREQT